MVTKWNNQEKWQRLMVDLSWKGNKNWGIADEKFLQEEIPHVETWARKMVGKFPNAEVQKSFRKFFWKNERMTQHDYTRKNQAVAALQLAYILEQENAGHI